MMKPIKLFFITLMLQLSSFTDLQSQYFIDSTIRAASVNLITNFGTSSGFFLQDTVKKNIYLVTAFHCIYNSTAKIVTDSIEILGYRENVDNDIAFRYVISLHNCLDQGGYSFDVVNDVAIIKFAKIIDRGTHNGIEYPSYVKKLSNETQILSWPLFLSVSINEVITGSDLFIVGFPRSLSVDKDFDLNRPLLRKGIIAGKDLTNKRIIGDLAVYFGNSGGMALVIHYNKVKDIFELKLAGLVSKYVPFIDVLTDSTGTIRSTDYKNSGYSVIIPFDFIHKALKKY